MTIRYHYQNVCAFPGVTGRPFLTDFTVEDGRFIPSDEHAPDGTEIRTIDMRGAFVMPAFIDTHAHPTGVAMTLGAVACTPPKVNSIDELVEALRASPAAQSGEGWIDGWGYDESLLAEKRSPTREDLDRVSTTQPVFIRRSDYHSAVVNSRALELAKITRETPDPAGAAFGRDASGEPDGRLIELGAVEFVEHAAKPPKTFESSVETLLELGRHYLDHGILATSDMMAERAAPGTDPAKDPLALYRAAAGRGMPVELNLYAVWKGGEDPFGMPDFSLDEKTGAVRYVGVKLFADGSISGRTAAVRNPYLPPPEGTPNEFPNGMMILTEPVFRAAVAWARRNGVQCAIHIMGDTSIDAVLGWLETEEPWLEGMASIRLEHVSMLRPDHLDKIEKLACRPALTTQIIFPFAEWRSYHAALTPEDFAVCYAVKSIADRIDTFALSSDAPCTTWSDTDDVFVCLEAAVTRRDSDGGLMNPGEAIPVGTALSLYTSRAAKVMPLEGTLGVIAPGARANFITLSANPFMIAPSKLRSLSVTGVWKDGEKLFG
ncbi:amidohydrolase [Sutterella sp.]|uniref:amidohydrolase n=1 Tax=Sutterella sp. TaxID=1981025 RepID=UPI0026DFE2F4|nr:amidohydrolase [Sutterella sp.]MDO5531795.1 amidohydrolase [Sutterella sp.]